MNFFSIQFVLFLAIALVGYYGIFREHQWQCLLFVSLVFFFCSGNGNLFLLLFTGITTWKGAQILETYNQKIHILKQDKTLQKQEKEKIKEGILSKRCIILWSVLFVNIGILAFAKYFADYFTWSESILLPLGISFYTFQSIGYLLDVYYEKYQAEKHFAKYMLFVGYFPQMIQGPINRYNVLESQFLKCHKWCWETATKAFYRIGYGLMKKYAIANIFAVVIANIFDVAQYESYSGAMILFGIFLYSAQQYADFSGGIDVVMGVSELFGIQMMENFKQPYFATSLADFWRRWHISLGKWMRDYVFYPFALTKPMKRLGKWTSVTLGKHMGRVLPAAIGNILVFFLVGLWHGAESHFIVWGLYNGLVIALSDITAPVYNKIIDVLHINVSSIPFRLFQIIRTFVVVNIGWYFDRIERMDDALIGLYKTLFEFRAEVFSSELPYVWDGIRSGGGILATVTCILVFLVSVLEETKGNVRERLFKYPVIIRWGIYTTIIFLTVLASTRVGDTGGFIYANF